MGEMPLFYPKEKSILSAKMKREEHPQELETIGFTVSPSLLPLGHTLFLVMVFRDFALLIKSSIKNAQA